MNTSSGSNPLLHGISDRKISHSNPFTSASASMATSPARSPAASDSPLDGVTLPPAPASVVQTINIRSHVPVTLDINDSNYSQWRCFFDSVLGKFGLTAHVSSPPALDQRDADWVMTDHVVVNWIYTTISKNVFDIIYRPRSSAFAVWDPVESLFRDNELQRAVYLEAEFRTLQQGETTITDYTARLKTLADNLRDVGQPVSEPSQVLNLLRGLNPKYRHVKPVITAKFPPHTFMSARSYLLLEELCAHHDEKMDAGQALYAGHCSSSNNAAGDTDASPRSGGLRNGSRTKKRGRGRNSGSSANGGLGRYNNTANNSAGPPRHPNAPGLPWAAGYNPWTGLVQAWPMPFRAPGSGVLGPRPPFQPQQAMAAQHQLDLPGPGASSSSSWDQQALLSALNSVGVPAQAPPSSSDWYMDTGASAHMSNAPGSSNSNCDAPL
ncbi:uncharacterized protein LOC133923398 [Phragmites australis]|uniref:uncharacterized protein LOC133923398 n=1 Tax=Phragmites australis TaxID=29695 RepID=UPI002D766646|nr:uncharacterized protein LOC133923398 [Phragmites australis]